MASRLSYALSLPMARGSLYLSICGCILRRGSCHLRAKAKEMTGLQPERRCVASADPVRLLGHAATVEQPSGLMRVRSGVRVPLSRDMKIACGPAGAGLSPDIPPGWAGGAGVAAISGEFRFVPCPRVFLSIFRSRHAGSETVRTSRFSTYACCRLQRAGESVGPINQSLPGVFLYLSIAASGDITSETESGFTLTQSSDAMSSAR